MEREGTIRRRFCHTSDRFCRHRPGARERHARKCRPSNRLAESGQNRDAGPSLATSHGHDLRDDLLHRPGRARLRAAPPAEDDAGSGCRAAGVVAGVSPSRPRGPAGRGGLAHDSCGLTPTSGRSSTAARRSSRRRSPHAPILTGCPSVHSASAASACYNHTRTRTGCTPGWRNWQTHRT